MGWDTLVEWYQHATKYANELVRDQHYTRQHSEASMYFGELNFALGLEHCDKDSSCVDGDRGECDTSQESFAEHITVHGALTGVLVMD
jgi:hypothetical protein